MIKFLSEINGTPILLFQERAIISTVTDYLFEAETGKMLALFARHPLEKLMKAIPTGEIKAIGTDFILINSLDSLTDPKEIVKVQKALSVDPKMIGEAVVTENGKKVGKVKDATIDLIDFKLDKLYVSPAGKVQMLARELIIPASKIITIEKKKIIIKDNAQKLKSTVFAVKTVSV